MLRDVICKRCSAKLFEEETVRTTMPRKGKLCDECKVKSIVALTERNVARNKSECFRKKVSARMKSHNPMWVEETCNKVSSTLKLRYEAGEIKSSFQDPEKLKEIKSKGAITPDGRRRISERMKANNPMMDEAVAQKMAAIQRKNVVAGLKVYKKGVEHHLWKGNRPFSEVCRVRLHPVWTFPILQRDGFSCTRCRSSKKLQVHHLRPFRTILAEVKREFGLATFMGIKDDDLEPYIQSVLNKHDLKDGLTLCKKCHSIVDEFYHEDCKHRT